MNIKYIFPIFFLLFFCCATNNHPATVGNANKPPERTNTVTQEKEKPTEQPSQLERFRLELTNAVSYAQAADIYTSYLNYLRETPPKTEAQKKESETILAAFTSFVSNIQIQKNTIPSETVKNAAFKTPFSVTVTEKDSKKPLEAIPLVVSFPVSAKNGVCEFSKTTVYTDSAGKAEFIAPLPTFCCNSSVTFSLEIPAEQGVKTAVQTAIPYKVYTELRNKGSSIAIVDLDKNGKPTSSSQTSSLLLTALIRTAGFSNIGNSDFTSQVLSGSAQTVQREAASLFGNSVTCLIYGTTSYETVSSNSNTEVTLTATVFVRNIPKNTELFSYQTTVTASNTREAAALTEARQQLAVILAEQIKYGL